MNPFIKALENLGDYGVLFIKSLRHINSLFTQRKRLVAQTFEIGNKTLPIILVLSFFMGVILSLQVGYGLTPVGASNFIGAISGLALTRELIPLLVAFIIAGRVGSSIAAELGSMQLNEEINALKVMKIPPEKILVLPRIIGILIATPLLTALGLLASWYGGGITLDYVEQINSTNDEYWNQLKKAVEFKDVINGISKATAFGLAVVLIASNKGLKVRGGPRELGITVTQTVITGLFLTFILDYIFTRLTL